MNIFFSSNATLWIHNQHFYSWNNQKSLFLQSCLLIYMKSCLHLISDWMCNKITGSFIHEVLHLVNFKLCCENSVLWWFPAILPWRAGRCTSEFWRRPFTIISNYCQSFFFFASVSSKCATVLVFFMPVYYKFIHFEKHWYRGIKNDHMNMHSTHWTRILWIIWK